MPKSILKKRPQSPHRSAQPAAFPKALEERHKEVALHYANLIQQRKDVEMSIFTATGNLLDFPNKTTDPAKADPGDINDVSNLLIPFQPRDYDSLIEERNIDGKCGYVLCPKPHRVENTNARFRVLRSTTEHGKGLKFVERGELEKWCSDSCGMMAMHLQVQLSDTPVWERTGHGGRHIRVYGEENSENSFASRASDLADDTMALTNDLTRLALERGSRNPNPTAGMMEFFIRESKVYTGDERKSGNVDHSHDQPEFIKLIGGTQPLKDHSLADRMNWQEKCEDSVEDGDIVESVPIHRLVPES